MPLEPGADERLILIKFVHTALETIAGSEPRYSHEH